MSQQSLVVSVDPSLLSGATEQSLASLCSLLRQHFPQLSIEKVRPGPTNSASLELICDDAGPLALMRDQLVQALSAAGAGEPRPVSAAPSSMVPRADVVPRPPVSSGSASERLDQQMPSLSKPSGRMVVNVPPRYLGMIFGRFSAYLNALKNHFHVTINIDKMTGDIEITGNSLSVLQSMRPFVTLEEEEFRFDAEHTGALIGRSSSNLHSLGFKYPQVKLQVEQGVIHMIGIRKAIDLVKNELETFISVLRQAPNYTVHDEYLIRKGDNIIFLGIDFYEIKKIKRYVPNCRVYVHQTSIFLDGTDSSVAKIRKVFDWIKLSYDRKCQVNQVLEPSATLPEALNSLLYYVDMIPVNPEIAEYLLGEDNCNLPRIKKSTFVLELTYAKGVVYVLGTMEAIKRIHVYIDNETSRIDGYRKRGFSLRDIPPPPFTDPMYLHFFD